MVILKYFSCSQQISRPSSSRYIRFRQSSNGALIYAFNVRSAAATYSGRILTFRFTPPFTAGLSYYVALDSGTYSILIEWTLTL